MRTRTLQRKLGKEFVVAREGKQIAVLTREGRRAVAFRPDASWKDEGACAEYLKSKMPCATVAPPG